MVNFTLSTSSRTTAYFADRVRSNAELVTRIDIISIRRH